MARRDKKKDELSGSAPGWMVTYGDMMTLLLTFFVLLISFSTIHEEEFQRALASFKGAIGVLPKELTVIDPFKTPIPKPDIRPTEQAAKKLKRLIEASGLEGEIQIEQTSEGVKVTMQSPLFFDSGKAELKQNSLSLLKNIADIIAELPNEITIEGHTDNRPINTPDYPSNWELSAARANAVLRYMVGYGGVNASRIKGSFYGEHRPVGSNTTPEGRQRNRRVEIFIKELEKYTLKIQSF